ncbi:MAG: tRNA-dihydrouridine synthase family protein, partial [Lachnospiraceae bacterium]|nr:tRNA-dihydrouridine synthase family protein [Lachnospiraceae bacterium]
MLLKIGNIEIGRLALGPMAEFTDMPFRLLCKEQGADYMVTEMVSAKGIHYNSPGSNLLLESDPAEHPIALQLFGSDPGIIAEIAEKLEELPFDIYDINMGCPVPKVVNNGEGSALMKNPALAGEIVKAVKGATKKPV